MRSTIYTILLLLLSTYSYGQGQYIEFDKASFKATNGDTLNYRFLRPEVEELGQKYPLVLFLHGAGERGNDNESQLIHGGQMWLNPVNREKFPAFVVAPQCPEGKYWAYNARPESFSPNGMPILNKPTSTIEAVKELLDTFLEMPQVDTNRIYVMGLSMGGMATFDLAIRYPELFAAAIPICGTVNANRLGAAKSVNFRIYHGDADNVVPVEGSRAAYKALKKQGANVTYIEFPGVNHGSWTPAFNDSSFMSWLFNQKRQ